jgi:CubicO group peptidase (beta-lactamase class C family)
MEQGKMDDSATAASEAPLGEHGLSPEKLLLVKQRIADDIARERYAGAVILVARNGEVGLHEAFGHHDLTRQRPIAKDSVFNLFSITKALTNVLVFQAIERGDLALTTRVAEVIPEFAGGLREKITLYHLLTHRAGLPFVLQPTPGMYVDRMDEVTAEICAKLQCIVEPGTVVSYAPMTSHALLGAVVHRVDRRKRAFRQMVEQDIAVPLRMPDTAIGVRKDLRERKIVPVFIDPVPEFDGLPFEILGRSDYGPRGGFEEEQAEIPYAGGVSTAADIFRFAEMLRRGGELDGARILSPAMLRQALRNWTGDEPNAVFQTWLAQIGREAGPAYLGLGFPLRGKAIIDHFFGTLTSPGTFGLTGQGTSMFWVDPEHQVTLVCMTAGILDEMNSMNRFQSISDMVISAAI